MPSTSGDTFGSLLYKVGNSRLDESLELQAETVEVTVSGGAVSTVHVVPLNAPVLSCVERSRQYKHETLKIIRVHHVYTKALN